MSLSVVAPHLWCFFLMIRRPPRSTRMTHSFPTRRSSDLPHRELVRVASHWAGAARKRTELREAGAATASGRARLCRLQRCRTQARSEEHTSELQSLMRISYAVFCLKKKITLNERREQPTTSNQTSLNTKTTNECTL